MTAKVVKEELRALASAGLVVLENDEVGCGQWESAAEGNGGEAAATGHGADAHSQTEARAS